MVAPAHQVVTVAVEVAPALPAVMVAVEVAPAHQAVTVVVAAAPADNCQIVNCQIVKLNYACSLIKRLPT